jgi:hypothetical protein
MLALFECGMRFLNVVVSYRELFIVDEKCTYVLVHLSSIIIQRFPKSDRSPYESLRLLSGIEVVPILKKCGWRK